MAKKRLKIKDRQGNVVDYDISAASVTIDIEGKSLDVKLSEIAAALLQAVTEVTFNGTPHNRENGKINIGNQMQPDWSESSTTYPTYIRNKPNLARVATSGDYNDLNNKPTGSDITQQDIDDAVAEAVASLVDSAPGTLDTLKELAAALGNDANFAATIAAQLATKISGIKANGASTTLPVDQNGVVELPPAGSTISPATAAPQMDGTAGVGSSEKYAREDHVHPHDTSKQDALSFDSVPTPDSNNMVKSGGIYNAIANQVSQVVLNNIPADSVAIVDDVVTDDPEQVLSARQGKRLADSIAGLGLEAHEANGTLFISRVADNRSVPPTISYTETSTTITVRAAGDGTITLYRGGTEAANVVSNPITINKTSTASVVRFYATAQQTGKTVSEMASLAVTIPAYVAPNPRLTSPANNSSVNITRTASLVSTALSAQSDSPVTIPTGVASQSVAVTVNAPTEVIDFDNLLTDATHNDTFPFQMPPSNSLWIRWKKAVDNGYSSSNMILLIGKLASNSVNGGISCYKEGTNNMLFIEDANGDMVSAGAGVVAGTVPAGKWFACWFWGNASQPSHSVYFTNAVTIEYCYAVNYSTEKISGDTIAAFISRYGKLPLTIHNASYSNAGSQDLTVTHNGTDTVISNITTGATITVEAGDSVSISSGSVNFSVDVTSYTAGTATVVVKGADLSQPISIAVSGTGFTCDTVSVTATDANSTNGKNVVVTYDASGSNTGALTLTSSEFNTVSVTLNGTNA